MTGAPRRIAPALLTLVLLTVPVATHACSVCMGNANSKAAGALNDAIFLMLGCIALMLGGIGAFVFNLRKRAQAPLSPHAQFSQPATPQENTL